MEVFSVKAELCGGRGCEEFEAVVDTGSMVTIIPRDMAERIGVDFRQFLGPPIKGDLGVVEMRLEGKRGPAIVEVKAGVEPTIGVTTLEVLGFEVDTVKGRLKSKPLRI